MKKKRGKFLFYTILIVGFMLATSYLIKPLFERISFGLDLQGGFEILYQVESLDGREVTQDMLMATYKTISKRIDVLGVSEPSILIEGNTKIRVQLAGVQEEEVARNLLSKAASLTFRDTKDQLLMTSQVLKEGGASLSYDSFGKPVVSLKIKDKETFFEVTKKVSQMPNNSIVIWLDFEEGDSYEKEKTLCGSLGHSKCLSVARVNQGFASDVIIEGNFKTEEVKNLVDLINSGSLPTKLSEISSKTVSASLGADSLRQTIAAGIIGVLCIIVFMIFLYRFAGFLASVSILFYTLFTFFLFYLLQGVLTLPGIAALVIGIGMAIDSCVILFARIKEEFLKEKNLIKAFQAGSKHSFGTIMDSNITTLLVAVILFIFGESSIKGFATMLMISIFTTLLVMVFFHRFLMGLFVKNNFFEGRENFFLPLGSKKNRKEFLFMKVGKHFFRFVLLFFFLGTIFLWKNGLSLGIDFKGGSMITLNSTEVEKKEIEDRGYTVYDSERLDQSIVFKIEEVLEKDEIVALSNYFKEKNIGSDIGVVSNLVKKELIRNAFFSLIIASIGMVFYITIRFQFTFALASILTLFHDVYVIILLFSFFKLEVTSIFVAAILSIIGYSINDTIVIFDRIRENLQSKDHKELSSLIEKSIGETFFRSIVTTVTTLFPVVSLIIFGTHEIINFNIALLIGLLAGNLSSLFLASYLFLCFEKRKKNKPKKEKEEDGEVTEVLIKGINS